LANLLRQKANKGVVLKDVKIEKTGGVEELFFFVRINSKKIYSNNPHPHYQGFGYNIYHPQVANQWNNYNNLFQRTAKSHGR
jgi:hypothetical protein